MTEGIADPATNQPNDKHVTLYRKWGQTGTGILITGNVMVDHRYLEAPGNVVFQNEADLPVLREWATQSQLHGSQCWVQISHPGRQCPRVRFFIVLQPNSDTYQSVSWCPVAPSAVEAVNVGLPAFARPRALTSDEIKDIIERFVKAAVLAKTAGFAGVQIHGTSPSLLYLL